MFSKVTSDAITMQTSSVDSSDSTAERCRKNADISASATDKAALIDVYKNWSSLYDEDFRPEHYMGPKVLAEAVAEVIQCDERTKVKILDVAAGTGLVGQELHKLGFTNIDALDASEAMLKQLRTKAIYRQTFQEMFGAKPISIESNSYDIVTLSGGFVPGHLPTSALQEMIRMCKPGGYITIVMRYEYLQTEEYQELEPLMHQLVNENVWTLLKRAITPRYLLDKEGICFVFCKL